MARTNARNAAAGTGNQSGGQSGQPQGQRTGDDTGHDDGDDDDDLGDLLGGDDSGDDDDDDGDDDGDGSDDDGDDGDEGGDDEGDGVTQDWVRTTVESALDRRINVVLKEIRKDRQQGSGRGQRRGKATQSSQKSTGPDPADIRDARSAYREYVGDEIRFLSHDERSHAQALAAGMIRDRLIDGADPDDVGSEVAHDVAKQVKTLRKFYETRVVQSLRQQGRLAPKKGTPAPGKKSGPGSPSKYQDGVAKARELYAARMPKDQ